MNVFSSTAVPYIPPNAGNSYPFIGCFVDGNGALGGRIICDTGYISSRSEVNVISFIVKTIYLATVMFKQIADSVSGVVFRLSDF